MVLYREVGEADGEAAGRVGESILGLAGVSSSKP